MKVIMLNGSPRPNGNTYLALATIAERMKEEQVDSEIVQLGSDKIQGCIGCGKCQKLLKCVFDDDLVNKLTPKIGAADGLIIGTPVYFAAPNGSLLSLLDRLFYSGGYAPFEYKPAASIAVARRAGTIASIDVVNKYFSIRNMPVVSSKYWNEIHGAKIGEINGDEEGMQILRTLGANMAWMLKSIEAGKKAGISHPEPELPSARTNFVR